jgi:hypothetical protein
MEPVPLGQYPTKEDMEQVPDAVVEFLLTNPKFTRMSWEDLIRELHRRWAAGSTLLRDVPLQEVMRE